MLGANFRLGDPKMTQFQSGRSSTARKRAGSGVALRAYTVQGDAAKALSTMDLPQGAAVAIIPTSAAVDAKLRHAGYQQLKRSRWVVAEAATEAKEQGSTAKSARVGREAFEPDARARAMLRGVEYARADLRDAGGAYDLDQVRTLMHDVSRQAIDKRVKEGSLLAVPGPSNRRRFPTIQFNADGAVVPGLKAVQDTLGYESPWVVLNFLVNPDDRLNGERPIEVLRRGEVERVVESARRVGVQGA